MAVKEIKPIPAYQVNGEDWRVGWPEEFARRLVLSQETAPTFHAWAESRTDLRVSWAIVKMLMGIEPVIPVEGSNPELYSEEMTLPEVAKRMGMDTGGVEMEIDLFAKSWFNYKKKQAQIEAEKPKPPPEPLPPPPPDKPQPVLLGQTEYSDDLLTPTQLALLKKRGFDANDFAADKKRSQTKRNQEMQWFHSRLVESERILNDPNGKERQRQILINEMTVRRIDEKIMSLPVDNPDVQKLMEMKQDIERILISQQDALEKVCPFARSAINKITAVGALSEIMQGLRDFEANGNNQLRDGLFTAYEILVMDRESEQQPSNYRPGWVAYMLEAQAGLFDPNFKSKMPQAFCQTQDMAHLIAKKTINEKLGIKLPNLLATGAEGEYPDLPELAESAQIDLAEETGKVVLDDEVTAPLISVPLEGDNDAGNDSSTSDNSEGQLVRDRA
jgi:hypothetical protein